MYSAKIDGEPTTFGTSGMLYRSNKLMYDRATESLWNQFTGEPIAGPLADSGIKLPFFPSVLTTWEEWVAEHPDTTALDVETGVYPSDVYRHEWETDAVYYGYFNLAADDVSRLWPERRPRAEGDGHRRPGSGARRRRTPFRRSRRSRSSTTRWAGRRSRSLGGARSGRLACTSAAGRRSRRREGGLLRGADGALWTPGEDALTEIGGAGSLPRIPTVTSFWHGWRSFHPDAALYERN